MRLRKCPRCELNYIQEDEDYCKVCKREMKGEDTAEEVEMCTVCNEHPAMPGKDICLFCYKEMQPSGQENLDTEGEAISVDVGIDPVSSMDEIISDSDDDIPAGEYKEIEDDLSLDEMSDEEQKDDEDDDEDEYGDS
ncbi:MAG: hypothetical protein IKI84_06845 [Clostridia bacterium]|nr:hypothetical protein [Clostridia bacterium]